MFTEVFLKVIKTISSLFLVIQTNLVNLIVNLPSFVKNCPYQTNIMYPRLGTPELDEGLINMLAKSPRKRMILL